ncbi:MAG: AAA family ATPase [Bacteroidota bacterium]|nr:AAA family ATPase [Bacteroidota bacterium]
MSIHSIKLKNFKSYRDTKEFEFGAINILIGSNGSGKSNLISFFKLLNNIMNKNLQVYVKTTGKAGSYLYFGQKKSSYLQGEIKFRNISNISNMYHFRLVPTLDGGFVFEDEISYFNFGNNEKFNWGGKHFTPAGAFESIIPDKDHQPQCELLNSFIKHLRIFHLNDTSSTSRVKGFGKLHDNEFLREDSGNLAAFLFKLSKTHLKHFRIIEKTIQSVAPFFNRFDLKPTGENSLEINLKWLEKGSDEYFDAHHLSDGTLRFICLATLLLQPNPPSTIIIDEPELGLHPFAISKLSAMIKSASVKTQLIISTQSVGLLNNFNPEDIIIVERENHQSILKRMQSEKLILQ